MALTIVSYTTLTYYKDTYLMGRTAAISDALFPYYALKATQELKKWTGDNVDETATFPDEIQMCVCELAEHLYTAVSTDAKAVTSEKVGEYSVSYGSTEDKAKAQRLAVRNIIYNWLASTPYIERGIG